MGSPLEAKELPKRKSLRLRHYDYATPGMYFVTICVSHRAAVFGRITSDRVELSKLGTIAELCWLEIPHHIPNITLDRHVVMPNHLHGLIQLLPSQGQERQPGVPISTIINQYKSAVTRHVIIKTGMRGYVLWQRGYYEHVIRDELGLYRIREYIATNPLLWTLDRENLQRTSIDEFDTWLEHEYGKKPCPR